VKSSRVDQLNLIFACSWLVVGQQPDVSADAGAEKDVVRQGDDSLNVVIL
jgi:hypothetical protein